MTATEPMAERAEAVECSPGIYPGMSRATYCRIDAANFSTLKTFREPTERHAKECIERPRPASDDMELGNLIETALLESHDFGNRYIVVPDSLAEGIVDAKGKPYKAPKQTKEYAARLAAFGQQNIGKRFVDSEQIAIVQAIQDAVCECSIASELLSADGLTQVAIIWLDEQTGLLCKGLLDRLTEFEGRRVIVDLKTTSDARPEFWGKHCHDYGYAMQAAFYRWGCNEIGLPVSKFVHVICETEPPYGVAVRELDDDSQQAGAVEIRRHLDTYAKCKATGIWSGYPDRIEPARLPRYAFNETLS